MTMININVLVEKFAELKELTEMNFDNFQSWEMVYDNWEIGDTKIIGGSKNELVLKEVNRMQFLTMIPPGVIFPLHWHDFRERISIVDGRLTGLRTKKSYGPGELVDYPAFTKHHVQNQEEIDCYLVVDFFRDDFVNGSK